MKQTWCALGFVMLLAPLARAADGDPIQQAIDKGVAALKRLQQEDGTWPNPHVGATALAGLTLLECNVEAKDAAIQKAAGTVRQSAVQLDHTYSLALAILFLDRLGDPEDSLLIESLTLRLLAGQTAAGGWTYTCPRPDDKETRRLKTHLQQQSELAGSRELPKTKPEGPRIVSKEIQDQLKLLTRRAPLPGADDNSNTQFALLALWIGKRHGMPVENALTQVEQRFRRSQHQDGGWGYTSVTMMGGMSTMSMTCAGLLGLAVAHGSKATLRTDANKKGTKPAVRNLERDPAVRAGLLALGTAVGNPRNGKNFQGGPVIGGVDNYFLWSLERVAVAYGLQTIGNKDWYAWGAEYLLESQGEDGSWQRGPRGPVFGGAGDGGVNTCFALLFLRRANLAVDLSNSLKGQFKDPGEVTLKSGGVGGADLKKISLKPGSNPHENSKIKDQPLVMVGDPQQDAEITRLTAELARAKASQQGAVIDRFKKSPGLVYTQALAGAIRQLDGEAKRQARDALAERLTRMKADTLREKLHDDDAEIRGGAALACGMKVDRSHVPDLIALLEDPVPRVGKAAHLALKSLTGQDLGPSVEAKPVERAAAVAAWKAWWRKQADSSRK